MIEETLDRLTLVLRTHAPELWRMLRPAVAAADLDVLRRAVAPYELSHDLIALLTWRDGQEHGAPWWPALECGPLLRAVDAAQHYNWLRSNTELRQWCPMWVPIAHDGWNQAGLEIGSEGPGVVIDASFPDPPRVIAPSLTALLEVTADLIDSGASVPAADADARTWRARRDVMLAGRREWADWPHARTLNDVGDWPPYWRRTASDAA
jgi:hypothetical protein